jgi:hypothetical protein
MLLHLAFKLLVASSFASEWTNHSMMSHFSKPHEIAGCKIDDPQRYGLSQGLTDIFLVERFPVSQA